MKILCKNNFISFGVNKPEWIIVFFNQLNLYNNEIIIIFASLNKKELLETMNEENKKEKEELESDLLFYLTYHKEVSKRGNKIKIAFDKEIERIEKRLKEIGHK